jgi:hypothetical protein
LDLTLVFVSLLLNDFGSAWTPLLQVSALILGIVNGLILVWKFSRDRPILSVDPVLSETHQWFFVLPNVTDSGQLWRRYGFLTYVSVKNQGAREVALGTRRLRINTVGGKSVELRSIKIPEPQVTVGKNLLPFPVLGVRGIYFGGETMIKSGGSITGYIYYVYWFSAERDDEQPSVKLDKVEGQLVVKSIFARGFGNTAKTKILFAQRPLDEVKKIVDGIEDADLG